MKVIGLASDNKLICEVSREELEKFFNAYYKSDDLMYRSIRELKAGSELDLGRGYDHLSDIKSAFDGLKGFVKANQKIMKAVSSGLLLVAKSDLDDKQGE